VVTAEGGPEPSAAGGHLAAQDRRTSERRARRLVGLSASSYRYASRRAFTDAPVRRRLRELAERRPRWEGPRLHWLLVREGLVVNHERTERLYHGERLAVARRRRRKRVSEPRVVPPAPARPNERWSMDFVRDTLADGRAFRAFTVVDDFSRECPVTAADSHLSSERVIAALEQLAATRGLLAALVCDNGPEFTSRAFDAWAYRRDVKLLSMRPSEPVENAFAESFNGRLRDECLSANWFPDLADTRQQIEAWRRDYNGARPHSGLAGRTPAPFAREHARANASPGP
jgi:putative transposase